MTTDSKKIAEIVRQFDDLPDDAVVPASVTAAVHGVSERTVRRTYPSVQLSPYRKGQRVGTIRAMSRKETKPAAKSGTEAPLAGTSVLRPNPKGSKSICLNSVRKCGKKG